MCLGRFGFIVNKKAHDLGKPKSWDWLQVRDTGIRIQGSFCHLGDDLGKLSELIMGLIHIENAFNAIEVFSNIVFVLKDSKSPLNLILVHIFLSIINY